MDARTIPNGATLDFDVWIIGSGPAGLAAASVFIGKSLKVGILEAGGETEARDELGQTVPDAHMADVEFICQIQRVGGNAHAWTVRVPGEAQMARFGRFYGSDLDARPGFGLEEPWPVSDAELKHYHTRCAKFWEIPLPPEETPEAGAVKLGPDIGTTFFQFVTARTLLDKVRRQMADAPNIEMVTYAQAQSFAFEGSSQAAAAVNVVSEPGRAFTVKAGQFIVAANCISSTRLLQNSVTPQGHEPGNASDLLGRFFMDHPLIDGGVLTPSSPAVFDRMRAFDIHRRDGGWAMAHFRIARDKLARDNLPDMSCIMLPQRKARMLADQVTSPRQAKGHRAALDIRDALMKREGLKAGDFVTAAMGVDHVIKKGLRKLMDPQPNLGSGGWSLDPRPERRFDCFQVLNITEQPPRHDNRIYLTNETDSNGMRRCGFAWQLHDEDLLAIGRSQKVLRETVNASGLGTMETAEINGRPVVLASAIGHHLGTTRMNRDARRGVVDENCCVHGTGNLYVASGSVFPSGGYINPTFTICAFGMRIADHILAKRAA